MQKYPDFLLYGEYQFKQVISERPDGASVALYTKHPSGEEYAVKFAPQVEIPGASFLSEQLFMQNQCKNFKYAPTYFLHSAISQ